MQLRERIEEIVKGMQDEELFTLHNLYCELINDPDLEIDYMGSFDDIYYCVKPSEICRRMFYGDFNINHDYFYHDSYGNLCSCDYIEDCEHFCMDDIINHICDNLDDYRDIDAFADIEE